MSLTSMFNEAKMMSGNVTATISQFAITSNILGNITSNKSNIYKTDWRNLIGKILSYTICLPKTDEKVIIQSKCSEKRLIFCQMLTQTSK